MASPRRFKARSNVDCSSRSQSDQLGKSADTSLHPGARAAQSSRTSPPRPGFEGGQRVFGGRRDGRDVDRPQRRSHALAVLPTDVAQAVADQAHDAMFAPLLASGKPFSPSTTAIRMSSTPPLRRSLTTFKQPPVVHRAPLPAVAWRSLNQRTARSNPSSRSMDERPTQQQFGAGHVDVARQLQRAILERPEPRPPGVPSSSSSSRSTTLRMVARRPEPRSIVRPVMPGGSSAAMNASAASST